MLNPLSNFNWEEDLQLLIEASKYLEENVDDCEGYYSKKGYFKYRRQPMYWNKLAEIQYCWNMVSDEELIDFLDSCEINYNKSLSKLPILKKVADSSDSKGYYFTKSLLEILLLNAIGNIEYEDKTKTLFVHIQETSVIPRYSLINDNIIETIEDNLYLSQINYNKGQVEENRIFLFMTCSWYKEISNDNVCISNIDGCKPDELFNQK